MERILGWRWFLSFALLPLGVGCAGFSEQNYPTPGRYLTRHQSADLQPVAQAEPPKNKAAALSPPDLGPKESAVPLRRLYDQVSQRYAQIPFYTLRLKHRENIPGEKKVEEVVFLKFRQKPWSVYMKWVGQVAKGREVVYVKGNNPDQIHSLTAAGDIPFVSAGKRISLSPDNILVKTKSRYPITDAGLGGIIDRFGQITMALEKGDTRQGTALYKGLSKRPEFKNPLEYVLQSIPAQSDPFLSQGGQRNWFFDPSLHLPVLIVTLDHAGREVEYFCHDNISFPAQLNDDDFDPEKLWPGKK